MTRSARHVYLLCDIHQVLVYLTLQTSIEISYGAYTSHHEHYTHMPHQSHFNPVVPNQGCNVNINMPDKESADDVRAFAVEIRRRNAAARAAAADALRPMTKIECEEITRTLISSLRGVIIMRDASQELAGCYVHIEKLRIPHYAAELSLERRV